MNIKNLTGQRFGRLTVIEDTGNRIRSGGVIWLCQCSCGNLKEVPQPGLRRGHTKSCGCLRVEMNREHTRKGERNYQHGGGRTKLYGIWRSMKDRCFNLRSLSYKHYGGRGIKVCSEWREDFSAFRDFALAHGYREGLSIDREDNDGDYEPSNVQFITRSENVAKGNKIKRRDNSGRFLGAIA